MISKQVEQIIVGCDFFKNKKIEIGSIYMNDPLEKCFLVRDSLTKEKYKVRIQTPEFPHSVQNEYKALEVLKGYYSNLAPDILFSSFARDNILVTSYCEGESLDKLEKELDANDISKIIVNLTSVIRRLHSIKGNYFGDFSSLVFPTWASFFHHKLMNHVLNARKIELISQSDLSAVTKFYEQIASRFDAIDGTFLHFDIKPANIIYDKALEKVTLIDFELARFGDANMEFARLVTDYQLSSKLQSQLFIPLAETFIDLSLEEYKRTPEFIIYDLYSLLAYFTTSYIKHGIERTDLIPMIKGRVKEIQGQG